MKRYSSRLRPLTPAFIGACDCLEPARRFSLSSMEIDEPRIGLSERQRDILQYVKEYQRSTGRPPTRSEIQAHFNYGSPNTVQYHLRRLARAGKLAIHEKSARGIDILDGGAGIPILDVLGAIPAGQPLAVEGKPLSTRPMRSLELFDEPVDYGLVVRGDSMQNAGILHGDIAGIQKTDHAQPGDIIVALFEREVTLKRYIQGKTPWQVTLRPANPSYQDISVDLRRNSFAIQGRCVGIVRNIRRDRAWI